MKKKNKPAPMFTKPKAGMLTPAFNPRRLPDKSWLDVSQAADRALARVKSA